MPIYEFYSPDSGRIYSFYARSLAYAGKTPRCPDNPTYRMEKCISEFSVTGRAKEPGADAGDAAGADDAKLEAAMAEMEREFSRLGDADPDPRLMAKMMRKMAGLTGEKMPPEAEEMIARMEKGEDPEKLEAEFGDALDGMDAPESGDAGADSGAQQALRALRRLRPKRDPTLYEMSDFVG